MSEILHEKLLKLEQARVGQDGKGTEEWSEHQEAGFLGCSNNCRYCYAKKNAKRFGWKAETPWSQMIPNYRKLAAGYRKRGGITMYPTSHDITTDIVKLDKFEIQHLSNEGKIPAKGYKELMCLAEKRFAWSVVDLCIFQLKKLLKSGNLVLITTKPDPHCIQQLMYQLRQWRDQIVFRFTITSLSEHRLRHWEPHAPTFFERERALMHAHREGWTTSVSIEPYLDPDPVPLLLRVFPYVTETVWLGKLNYKTTEFNSDETVRAISRRLLSLPDKIRTKVRLKDSFQEVCRAETPYVNDRNLAEVMP
jgi:hypothetical protein